MAPYPFETTYYIKTPKSPEMPQFSCVVSCFILLRFIKPREITFQETEGQELSDREIMTKRGGEEDRESETC